MVAVVGRRTLTTHAEHAGIKSAGHLPDPGSGAGSDCFVARSVVGETGRVTGLDFTDEMFQKAKRNNELMGFRNVEFIPRNH